MDAGAVVTKGKNWFGKCMKKNFKALRKLKNPHSILEILHKFFFFKLLNQL